MYNLCYFFEIIVIFCYFFFFFFQAEDGIRDSSVTGVQTCALPILRLARECEIKTAESRIERVGGKDVLLVKRFDREKTAKGYTRARMVSGLTILRADEAPEARENWSYVILVEELRRIVDDAKKDARELFRRICFNSLISNLDDHPRNHAAIAKEKNV